MKPNERWARLTASAASCMNASDKEAFEAGWYAIWIGQVFSDYVGTPERGRVLFYALESTTGPAPRFTPVHTAWAAVSRTTDNWWQFGLGVELERGPGLHPRIILGWPMRLRTEPWLNIRVGAGQPVELRPDKGGELDFEPVCETMYQLVISTLEQLSRGQRPAEEMALLIPDVG